MTRVTYALCSADGTTNRVVPNTPGSPRAQMAATLRLYSVVMISATQLPRKQNAIFPSVCRGAIFVARNASRVSQSPKRIEIVE